MNHALPKRVSPSFLRGAFCVVVPGLTAVNFLHAGRSSMRDIPMAFIGMPVFLLWRNISFPTHRLHDALWPPAFRALRPCGCVYANMVGDSKKFDVIRSGANLARCPNHRSRLLPSSSSKDGSPHLLAR